MGEQRSAVAASAVAGADRRRVNLLLGAGLLVAVVAIVALGAIGSRSSSTTATADLVAQAALDPCPTASGGTASADLPGDALPCLNGGSVGLASLTGTPMVINVWGSWCPPCREELPWFAALHESAGDRLRVVGVDVMDTDAAALRTLIAVGAHYPVVVDQDGRTRGSLGWSSGTPVTLLVSSGGVIVERIVGRAPDEATLRRLVEDDLGVQLQG